MMTKNFFKLAMIAIGASFCLSAQSAMASRTDREIAMTKCSRDGGNYYNNGYDDSCNQCDPCGPCEKKKCEPCPCPEKCSEPCPCPPDDCGKCSSQGAGPRKGAAKAVVQGG